MKTLASINTQRLLLRQSQQKDVDDLFEVYSNPAVVRYFEDAVWEDKDEAIELIDGANKGLAENELFGWCIEHKDTGKVIGTCALFECDLENKRADIAYELHPDYWQQGLASELIPAVLNYGFGNLELHRIGADIDPRNTGSLKVAEKFGFQQEGRLREFWVDKDGSMADYIVLSLLKSEWLKLQTRHP